MLLILGKVVPGLFFPLGFALWTSALALILIWRKRTLAGLVLGMLSWLSLYASATSPLCRAVLSPLEKPYYRVALPDTATAIVLLGGATVPATPPRLHPETNLFGDRILHAARLWKEGRSRRLVTTGGRIGWMTDAQGSEAEDYATLLTGLFGVDSAAIALCPGSKNTRDDAVETRALFERRGWGKDIFLVTSAFHMRRAAALFRKQGFTVHEAPTDFFTDEAYRFRPYHLLPQESTLSLTYWALHEWVGFTAYRLLGWI